MLMLLAVIRTAAIKMDLHFNKKRNVHLQIVFMGFSESLTLPEQVVF